MNEKGNVSLVSETSNEAKDLLDFYHQNPGIKVTTTSPIKHKKHQFRKTCDICGGEFKGKAGVSAHKRFTHGIFNRPVTATI